MCTHNEVFSFSVDLLKSWITLWLNTGLWSSWFRWATFERCEQVCLGNRQQTGFKLVLYLAGLDPFLFGLGNSFRVLCVHNVGSWACLSGKLSCIPGLTAVDLPRFSGHLSLAPDFFSILALGLLLCLCSQGEKDLGLSYLSPAGQGKSGFNGFLLIITPKSFWSSTANWPSSRNLQSSGKSLCTALLCAPQPPVKLEVPEREAARARAHIIHTLWTSPRVTQIQLH